MRFARRSPALVARVGVEQLGVIWIPGPLDRWLVDYPPRWSVERTRGTGISVRPVTAFLILIALLLASTACRSSPGLNSTDVGPQAPDVIIRLAPSATDDQISDLVGIIVDPTAGPPHVSSR